MNFQCMLSRPIAQYFHVDRESHTEVRDNLIRIHLLSIDQCALLLGNVHRPDQPRPRYEEVYLRIAPDLGFAALHRSARDRDLKRPAFPQLDAVAEDASQLALDQEAGAPDLPMPIDFDHSAQWWRGFRVAFVGHLG